MTGQSGIGKVTFGGVDLTGPPYYAHLTTDAKYWFLDGQTSQQFPTGQASLVSSMPYFNEFLINAIFRIEPPDGTRTTMLSAIMQLAALLDPSQGLQKLTFAEFPYSYFWAVKQTSTPQNETTVPYMMELAVDFACTGPAYSVTENVVTVSIGDSTTYMLVTSAGDLRANPRWRFTASAAYSGDVQWQNITTGEQLTWTGSLGVGDILDVIMDEYGVPYTVILNGDAVTATASGSAWPHLISGVNTIALTGPNSGTAEIRWRDRWLVGQASAMEAERIAPTSGIMHIPYLTQGIANDGTYNYGISNGALYKYDKNWNLIAQNLNSAAQTGSTHQGDGEYYNGKLYIFTCADTTIQTKQLVGVFNASDLSYIETFNLVDPARGNPYSVTQMNIGGCGVDAENGYLLGVQFGVSGVVDPTYVRVFRFDINTFDYVDYIDGKNLAYTIYNQGISSYGGHYYFTTSSTTAPGVGGGVVEMNPDGSDDHLIIPGSLFTHGGEMEGLDAKADAIRVLCGGYIYTFPTTFE